MVTSVGDPSVAVALAARGADSRVEVVEAASPLSAGAARNLGREHAGDVGVLLFVDADCSLEPGGVRLLHAELIERHLSCVSARVLRDGGGAVARVRHALEFKEAEGRVSPPEQWLPPSTTMLCRAAAFDRIGGFPDMWPGEDLVFMHRVRSLGMRAELSRLVRTRHLHPRGVREMLAHQYRLGFTSAVARVATGMTGGIFVRHRWLAPLLLPARLLRLVVWQGRSGRLLELVALWPLMTAGLAAWTVGFVRGAGRRAAAGAVVGQR